MKNKVLISLMAVILSLSFYLIVFAEYKPSTDTRSNKFSVEQTDTENVEIDWVDTLTIQWCEYPFTE